VTPVGPKWIARGRAYLEAAPEAPSKAARTYLRIYYRAESGETLCVEAGPLTWQAASASYYEIRRGAIAVQEWNTGRCVCHGREGHPPPPINPGARLVRFPSQVVC
jgi:hypothetical protein